MTINTYDFMRAALVQAQKAKQVGEVPVGAVVVHHNTIIAAAHNLCISLPDPTAHAEMLALRQAAQVLQTYRLEECDLYVTLEPCAMCAQAAAHARIRRIIFGAYDPKGGSIDHGARVFSHSTCHHQPEVIGGIHEQECAGVLRSFFQERR